MNRVVEESCVNKDGANLGEGVDNFELLDFDCEYTDNIPQILKSLNISLAFTSYQVGRLMLLRSDGNELDVNYKKFQRPMGLVASEKGLTLGVFNEVINFQREDGLVDKIKKAMPKIEQDLTAPKIKLDNKVEDLNDSDLSGEAAQKKTELLNAMDKYREKLYEPVDERVDACFITRSSHYSGMINIHDIDWGQEGLWVVNSSFSCLCTLEPDYSFVPRWKPYFISELKPEDRCHLNGMTLKDGKPAYVTTFSKFDSASAWRNGDRFDGSLMDVQTNSVVVDGLAMPHSPRWYMDKVYFCNSGYGLLSSYEPDSRECKDIVALPGFTRGIDFYGPIAFVGLSQVRNSDVTRPAPLAEKFDETFSGIWLINLDDSSVIGHIKFTGNVEQVYDVAVIQGCTFPELIEPSHPRMRNHFCHPKLQPFG